MLRNFFEDDTAAVVIEWGLTAGLVAGLSLPVLTAIGDAIRMRFEVIGAAFTP